MNAKTWFAILAAAAAAGCTSLAPVRDAEGFTYFDGTLETSVPGDFFILRFEYPRGIITDSPAWMKGLQKWNFVEVRQLKDAVTVVDDGQFRVEGRRVAGVNWAKWLKPGSRNVRVKFVDDSYTLAAANVEAAPAGFTPLFNGRDLSGWKGVTREEKFDDPDVRRAAWPEKRWEMQDKADKLMREHWFVKDGALFFDGLPGGYSLATAKDYGNFEMIADWRLLRVLGDSGFYLRGLPQVQIWDPHVWGGLGSGGLYNNSRTISNATSCEDRPIGDWNRCRMRMVGDRVSVWLNGVKVVDNVSLENYRDAKAGIPLIQQIELQCHGDPIEFRNLFIRELPEEDVPCPAKAVRGERVDLLKDGIAGWEAVDPKARMGWTVRNGVLSNDTGIDPTKTSRGGAGTTNLRTKRTDFLDFDISYDVLVPAKCNSGVYLRGRYELQVNDSYGRKVDCHNMAALYEHLTPSVAAEKPAGEWQHVDATLYRRHLTVVLNGVKIIDNQPIRGVTPAAIDGNEFVPGPILLQGDHSNASFRNMVLTKIER